MRTTRCTRRWLTVGAAVLGTAGALATAPALAQTQGHGLSTSAQALMSKPEWRLRFERDWSNPLNTSATTPLWLLGQRPQTLRLLGDYPLAPLWGGARGAEFGGLRLTGGVLLNLRNGATGLDGLTGGAGYAGIGYAGGNLRGDWGFSADLGLTGLGFGQMAGPGSINTWGLRELRLSPQIRLGANWSF